DERWTGLELQDTILYELHVGTFTPEGTFGGVASRLTELRELGVTAIELMPVADFPGRWNWGYDGVAPFAPAHCYGTPDDLRSLVDQAHSVGLAVYLDVVYNHFGPDGAYQASFSRFYYSEGHRSPWGAGINFDGPLSEPVRDYAMENALRWVHEYHIDGLRLDATHAIVDDSRRNILASLSGAVRGSLEGSGRRVQVIAEDHRNLASLVKPERDGGCGLDGVWSDDFHHQMRRALNGDSDGYFQDFDGSAENIAATARQGWFYTGQPSAYFGHARGSGTAGVEPWRFLFFLQNHDQVGNRAFGDRVHHKIDPAAWRAASALLLVLPETPLLFMGQEWAASTPFQYFTDHHAELGRLVTEGRRREFGRFAAFADPETRGSIPDPQSEATFLASRLQWEERACEPHSSVLRLYRSLLELRRREPALRFEAGRPFEILPWEDDSLIAKRSASNGDALLAVVRLRGAGAVEVVPGAGKEWTPILATEDPAFAPDPHPPRIAPDPLTVEFMRPGAVLFRTAQKGESQ
ncbi:MAG: malto-oligosyltrehalose trehalohydrolase, partial [Bryobacteraceae bacterium]